MQVTDKRLQRGDELIVGDASFLVLQTRQGEVLVSAKYPDGVPFKFVPRRVRNLDSARRKPHTDRR
jgi:hypothetical protein